ncbi:MAG: hypothetical protein R6X02_20080 [Enhygromyxa sp.]
MPDKLEAAVNRASFAVDGGAVLNDRQRLLNRPQRFRRLAAVTNDNHSSDAMAYTHWMSGSSWTRRAGFQAAADAVVEAALTQGAEKDLLIYPTLYLYRHYIELYLKELASKLDVAPRDSDGSHSLHEHWRRIRTYLVSNLEYEDDHLTLIDSVIKKFTGLDPTGTHTRYATAPAKRSKPSKQTGDTPPVCDTGTSPPVCDTGTATTRIAVLTLQHEDFTMLCRRNKGRETCAGKQSTPEPHTWDFNESFQTMERFQESFGNITDCIALLDEFP